MSNAKCERCGKFFNSPDSCRQHINAKHGGNGKILKIIPLDREESFASRAIQAQLDVAMGLGTDDDWLLP